MPGLLVRMESRCVLCTELRPQCLGREGGLKRGDHGSNRPIGSDCLSNVKTSQEPFLGVMP